MPVLVPLQVIIPASLDPEAIMSQKGEDRLKERVQKVLAGIHKKLEESDPRMRSASQKEAQPEWM